jgi:hypothetical protein
LLAQPGLLVLLLLEQVLLDLQNHDHHLLMVPLVLYCAMLRARPRIV